MWSQIGHSTCGLCATVLVRKEGTKNSPGSALAPDATSLDLAVYQGIKNSWGLLAPLSADPGHLAASVNMASCIALTWAAAALFSGCATAPRYAHAAP